MVSSAASKDHDGRASETFSVAGSSKGSRAVVERAMEVARETVGEAKRGTAAEAPIQDPTQEQPGAF